MCQGRTGAYVSLLAPEEPTIPLATQKRLPLIQLHVVPITTHTHVGLKSLGEKKRKKKRREKKRKRKKQRKENKREENTRQEEEARKDENAILADPRN